MFNTIASTICIVNQITRLFYNIQEKNTIWALKSVAKVSIPMNAIKSNWGNIYICKCVCVIFDNRFAAAIVTNHCFPEGLKIEEARTQPKFRRSWFGIFMLSNERPSISCSFLLPTIILHLYNHLLLRNRIRFVHANWSKLVFYCALHFNLCIACCLIHGFL